MRNIALSSTPLFGLLFSDLAGIAAINVDLVSKNDKWEVIGVVWASLDEEFVSPVFKVVKGFRGVDVIDEDAAVCSSVEGYAEALEAFLAGCVPDLHCDEAVVDLDLLGEEVGANGGFVLTAELLVNELVHEGGLADSVSERKKVIVQKGWTDRMGLGLCFMPWF